MLRKRIMSALVSTAIIFSAFSGFVYAENENTFEFDANKSWANMQWVAYGKSGGMGDVTRNFTMTNEYGKELSFTLVETYDSTDAKYWIIANDRYGTKAPGTSVKYDPTVSDTIANYTNVAFVQGSAWAWNLPEAMIETIDYDHVWATEKANSGTIVPEAYTFTAGVVIPAVWEMEKYGDRMMIDFLPEYDADYMFRTPYSDSYYHGIKKGSNETTAEGVSRFKLAPFGANTTAARGIRPEFFVNSDFFKTGAVDLATAGSLIKSEISRHTYEDLSKIYTDAEISTYLPEVVIPPLIEVAVGTTDGKDATVGNTLKATVEGAEGTPEYQWYAGDDMIEGANSDTYVLTYNEHEKNVKCFVTVDGAEVESNAVTVTSQFDETKQWPNLSWVSYGTSGGLGDATRNFTMKNEYGKELSFTLVETYNNAESKYWIIANDRYGTKYSGTSTKYDPTVSDTIANYANASLVQKTPWAWNLPETIIESIDYDHVWITEKANSGAITEPYTFQAGVVIPAIWEMWKYGDRMMIDFLPEYDGANYAFRTAHSDSYYQGLSAGTNETTAEGVSRFKLTPLTANDNDARGVRPEFFVNSEFFKNAKIDLATAGSLIKSEISKYSYEDLSKLYTDAEIDEYLSVEVPHDFDISVLWTDGSRILTGIEGVTTIVADVVLDSRADKNIQTFVAVALYDDEERLVQIHKEVVDMAANEKGRNVKLNLSNLSNVTNDYTLKLFVWDNVTFKPLCKSVLVEFSNIENLATTASVDMQTGEQVFYQESPVTMNFSADGTFVWEVEDYYGNIVRGDLVSLEQQNEVEVNLTGLEPGYYEVATYVKTDSELVATDRTSFAVVEDTEFVDDKDTSMFGINTHISAGFFRNTTDLIADEVYKLGVKNVRDHYGWSRLSTEEDVITFTDKDKAFIQELKKYDIGALMASGFDNSVYMEEGVKVPLTEKAINGFANYTEAVVDEFAKNDYPLNYLEIWNEYWSWDKSTNSAKNYATLFDSVYNKLNTKYPSLGLAAGFNNIEEEFNYWNDNVVNSGNVKNRIGLATVHAYGGVNLAESNETRPEVLGKIENSMDDLWNVLVDNDLEEIDIRLTETGYSSLPIDVNGDAIHSETNGALSSKYCVTEKEAGMYLPRCVLLGLSKGAKSVYPYQLTDGSYNINTHESFFGLLRGDGTVCGLYSPKPQYAAYATITRVLDATEFSSLEINGDCYEYSFIGDNKAVTAVYSIGDNMTYEYYTNNPVEVTDIMGKTKVVNPIDGKVELLLTGNVQYIIER